MPTSAIPPAESGGTPPPGDRPAPSAAHPGSGLSAPEAALRAAEVRLQAVLENAPIAIWTWEDWRITYFSRFWARITGREPGQLSERAHWADALAPEDRERARQEFHAAVRAGRAYEGEGDVERPDGTLVRTWTRAIPVHDLKSGQLFYQGFTVDISAREQLQERLRQAQKMEAVGQFAGGVAHDFNNLLTAIRGYIQLMHEETGPDHPLRAHMDLINRAADQAGTLMRQLMAVSQRQMLERAPLDLNRLIREMRGLIQRVMDEKTRFTEDLSPNLWPVFADTGMLEQLMLQLWLNARDAMPAGGELGVRTRNVELDQDFCRAHPHLNPAPHVELSISDTGSGMGAESRERLFEPFFSTRHEGQAGLGLAMVYGVVRQHGGAIEVASTPGTGTTIRVFLPAIEGSSAPVATRAPSEVIAGGRERILVGEDDPLTRSFTRSALEMLGYQVMTAESSEEALRLFSERGAEVDLAILDVVMPGMGGRELALELKRRRPGLRVLLVSGYHAASGPREHPWPEAEDFLPKPFSPSSLGKKVREVLDRDRRAP